MLSAVPTAGTTLEGRFVIETPIGAGGMGSVYRARDLRTDGAVAIKVMRARDDLPGDDARRFEAEIGVLAELSHPAIVAYVAHGHTDDGRPFLAMEHLSGEDLDARLSRGSLGISESLALVRRVAGALAEAHRRGIVHRDLKPSNLFLRDGAPERVVVLDFGVARQAGGAATGIGIAIGTPEYMAPEQAQGARDVGPAADVFALGCVLYQCLVGRSPFAAEHIAATLAKILFEDPPPASRLRPEVPEAVSELLARMLQKRPEERIADASALLDALGEVSSRGATAAGSSSSRRSTPPPTRLAGLGRTELELVSVILATPPKAVAGATTLEAGSTTFVDEAIAVARRAVALSDLTIERLVDGSVVAALGRQGESAADQAVAAARCAAALRTAFPGTRVAIATARRLAGARGALGEAIDRAGQLLRDPAPTQAAPGEADAGTAGVRLDEVTAGLLDGRVRTVRLARGVVTLHALHDEPTLVDDTRLLLGRPTPCVGREQELATLESALATAFTDEVSRAVVVIAPAGVGKSRLRHELSRRLETRKAAGEPPPFRLDARGELLRAGSPYGLIAPALRRAFDIATTDAPPRAQAKLVEGVSRTCGLDEAAADPLAALLGELCDVPFSVEGRPELESVRQDPRQLQARCGDALVALLGGEGARRSTLVLIEDAHWGDRPSLDLLGRALRELDDRALFVAAFARPELRELSPDLWQGRAIELPLPPLGRRACERLVERVAGDRLDAATVARVAVQSAGNALFLEELVRAAAERGEKREPGEDRDGSAETPPGTVLAMLQTRIARLAPRERRVLRLASVFGETFTYGGVRALLGEDDEPASLDDALAELRRREIVEPLRVAPPRTPRRPERSGGAEAANEAGGAIGDEVALAPASPRSAHELDEQAFRFRHALMREAAYGLLTDEDRRLGHQLAARWLEDREPDPLPIAEHWLRGEANEEAVPWLLRAAERAIDRDDFAEAGRHAARGRALAGDDEIAGEFSAIESLAAYMRWDLPHAAEAAAHALAHARDGTRAWIRAMRAGASVAAYGKREAIQPFVARLASLEPAPPLRAIYCDALLQVGSAAAQTGLTRDATPLIERAERLLAETPGKLPLLHAWAQIIRCTLLRHTDDDLATQLLLLREALAASSASAAPKLQLVLGRDVLAEALSRAGQHDEAETLARRSVQEAARVGGVYGLSHARLALANVLIARGESRHAEAELLARELLAIAGISAGYRAMALDVLAQVALARGAAEDAERAAREAIALSSHTPVRRWLMSAHLADALLARGREGEAEELARGALAELDEAGSGGYAELALILSAGHAAARAGDPRRAAQLARRARQRVVKQASAFVDREAFARFLRQAPGIERLHALEKALERALGGEGAPGAPVAGA
jgi:hypothetical protein